MSPARRDEGGCRGEAALSSLASEDRAYGVVVTSLVGAPVIGESGVGEVVVGLATPASGELVAGAAGLALGGAITSGGMSSVGPLAGDAGVEADGAGAPTMGVVALAFTPLSSALELSAGRTREGVGRAAVAPLVRRAVAGAAARVVEVVVSRVTLVEGVGVAVGPVGTWSALGGAAVFRATSLVAGAPGVSWATPSSPGRAAYQPTAARAATAATPAATAPAGTARRGVAVRCSAG